MICRAKLRSALPGAALAWLVVWCGCRDAAAQTLDDAMAPVAKIAPLPDGVVRLSLSNAAMVRWNGKQATLTTDTDRRLAIDQGVVARWNADNERPTWSVTIPRAGAYRVVAFQATLPGYSGSAVIQFLGAKRQALNVSFEAATPAPAPGQEQQSNVAASANAPTGFVPGRPKPVELGELELAPGDVLVEYRPTTWSSPFEIIRLAEIRLVPLDALRASSRAAAGPLTRAGVDALPAVKACGDRVLALRKEVDALNRETRRRDFGEFHDFDQFLAFDRLPSRLREAEPALKAANRDWERRGSKRRKRRPNCSRNSIPRSAKRWMNIFARPRP